MSALKSQQQAAVKTLDHPTLVLAERAVEIAGYFREISLSGYAGPKFCRSHTNKTMREKNGRLSLLLEERVYY